MPDVEDKTPIKSNGMYPNSTSSSTTTTPMIHHPMAKAIQVLHPSRYTLTNSSSTLFHHPSGGTGGKSKQHRFSPLLLEHGEKELQDWAVVASSSRLKHRRRKKRSGTNHTSSSSSSSSSSTRGIRNNRVASSTASVSSISSSSTLSSSASSSSRRTSNKTAALPCTNMKSIKGRLRLCSKSIVFEPNDVSRGILRFPFDKMENAPFAATTSNSGIASTSSSSSQPTFYKNTATHSSNGFESTIYEHQHHNNSNNTNNANHTKISVVLHCQKFFEMKKNNIIAPFDSISIMTEFKFMFLHSTPKNLLSLSKNIYTMIKTPNPAKPLQTSINEIITPMLDKPFDPSNLINVREKPQTNNLRSTLLGPLLTQHGCSIVTNERIYFQPLNGIFSTVATKASSWVLSDVVATARRYYGLKDCAVELFFEDGPSIVLALESMRERELVMRFIPKSRRVMSYVDGNRDALGKGATSSSSSGGDGGGRGGRWENVKVPCHTDREFICQALAAWREGSIGNFDYLLALNSSAGRSFHDLSRYPVFPWVLKDYSSSKLDLSCSSFLSAADSENDATIKKLFRDLSKPIGALDQERLECFQTRMKNMQDDFQHSFLYGTHYSTAAYCLYYLVRCMPEQMLCLQNGKYDTPDRLFHSIKHSYSSVLANHADVKESIPQFYDPKSGVDMLLNLSGLQLGVTQNGIIVNDVELPKWAKSPKDFLKKNRRALESVYTTSMLPKWIDLVFGVKARGEGAAEALNVFHPMSYMSPEDYDKMETEEKRIQAELHATEFGICPDMIFVESHPQKLDGTAVDPYDIVASGRSSLFHGSDMDGRNDRNAIKKSWENLQNPQMSSMFASDAGVGSMDNVSKPSDPPDILVSNVAPPFQDEEDDELVEMNQTPSASSRIKKATNLSLSGSGDSQRHDGTFSSNGTFGKDQQLHEYSTNASPLTESNIEKSIQSQNSSSENTNHEWDLKIIATKSIHGDAVSGCYLSLDLSHETKSYLTSTSLDGELKVHTLPNAGQDDRRGFSATTSTTASKFSYLGSKSVEPMPKLHTFRTHASSDPLACLNVVSDNDGGQVAFTGGHDDVVMAYGINSACALASVYSHRDAVNGIELIPRPSFYGNASFTHVMVSGSWDATVKLWSVTVAEGETVSIGKEPLVELFDAESPVVSVAVQDVDRVGLLIAAGCSDGSFVVWSYHGDDKRLIHKEESKRGYGPCASIKWAHANDMSFLYAGFGNGRVTSFSLKTSDVSQFYPVSKVHIGSPVQCIFVIDKDNIFAGCADGGLRFIAVGDGGRFDFQPVLWKTIHGSNSPGITSLYIVDTTSFSIDRRRSFTCASGAGDGSVALFQVEKL